MKDASHAGAGAKLVPAAQAGQPTLPVPRNPARAVRREAFLIRRPLVDAWFLRRSDQLIVTFDNLSSVGQFTPAQPWLLARSERAGGLGRPLRRLSGYRAAKSVTALDGSALHLAAFVLPRDARVTMILRRSRANAGDYIRQYKSFLGITPAVVDMIRHDWVAGNAGRADFRSVGELDLPRLFAAFKAMGLIPQGFRPDLPGAEALRAQFHSLQDRRRAPFRILGADADLPKAQSETQDKAA